MEQVCGLSLLSSRGSAGGRGREAKGVVRPTPASAHQVLACTEACPVQVGRGRGTRGGSKPGGCGPGQVGCRHRGSVLHQARLEMAPGPPAQPLLQTLGGSGGPRGPAHRGQVSSLFQPFSDLPHRSLLSSSLAPQTQSTSLTPDGFRDPSSRIFFTVLSILLIQPPDEPHCP